MLHFLNDRTGTNRRSVLQLSDVITSCITIELFIVRQDELGSKMSQIPCNVLTHQACGPENSGSDSIVVLDVTLVNVKTFLDAERPS